MKTANEILEKIKKEKEDARRERVTAVTQVIQSASEKMYEKSVKNLYLEGISCNFTFRNTLEEPEIKTLLAENGFEVKEEEYSFYLKIK